jgi:stage V sporulation protein S
MEMIEEHNNDAILRVSSSSAPQAVAAAISKCISESHKYPTLRAIGHGAVGQAVKALAIARGYVAPRGTDLAFVVGFDTIENAEGKEISAMVFKTFPR